MPRRFEEGNPSRWLNTARQIRFWNLHPLSLRVRLIWCSLLVVILLSNIWKLQGHWRGSQGWEIEWIARSIASGNGYSFDARHRWLFEPVESDQYFPTAWKEPVYPLMLGMAFRFFGDYGKLVIQIFQMICIFLTCITSYYVGKRIFNEWTGLLAGSLLALFPAGWYIAHNYLDNASLAGLLVSVTPLLILWCLERPSVKRGIVLGLFLGSTVLTIAPALLFAPISVLLILYAGGTPGLVRWKTALSVVLTVVLLLLPWMIRNYKVFGHFVPVRNAFGSNLSKVIR